MKEVIKLCKNCAREIDTSKDKYILLGTYEGKTILEEGYFHFKCFNEWHNKKVTEKAMNLIKKTGGQAIGILNKINSFSKRDEEILLEVGGIKN